MAVVKAVATARCLPVARRPRRGANSLGVATSQEGVDCARRGSRPLAGDGQLSEPRNLEELPALAADAHDPAAQRKPCSPEPGQCSGRRMACISKLDTGMPRLGLTGQTGPSCCGAQRASMRAGGRGVFHAGRCRTAPMMGRSLTALLKAAVWGGAPGMASPGAVPGPPPPGNSAGTLRSPSSPTTLVRWGWPLYGHCPCSYSRWQRRTGSLRWTFAPG